MQNTEFYNNHTVVEEEDKEHYEMTIKMLKDLILTKDEEIQNLGKEINNLKNDEGKSIEDFDIKSKESYLVTGDENLKEKLEKYKNRLKQYKDETESSIQQVR